MGNGEKIVSLSVTVMVGQSATEKQETALEEDVSLLFVEQVVR